MKLAAKRSCWDAGLSEALSGFSSWVKQRPWDFWMKGTSCGNPHISTSRFFVPTQTYLSLHFLAHLGTAVWNKVPSLPAPERLASKPRWWRAMRTQLPLGPLWVLADRMGQEACIFDLLPLASLSALTLGDWFPLLCGPNSRLNSARRFYPYRRCCHISSGVQTLPRPLLGLWRHWVQVMRWLLLGMWLSLMFSLPFFFSFRVWEAKHGQSSFRTSTTRHYHQGWTVLTRYSSAPDSTPLPRELRGNEIFLPSSAHYAMSTCLGACLRGCSLLLLRCKMKYIITRHISFYTLCDYTQYKWVHLRFQRIWICSTGNRVASKMEAGGNSIHCMQLAIHSEVVLIRQVVIIIERPACVQEDKILEYKWSKEAVSFKLCCGYN